MIRLSHILIKSLMLAILALPALAARAQMKPYVGIHFNLDSEYLEFIDKMIYDDLTSRKEPGKVLPITKYLINEDIAPYWTDGLHLYESMYSRDDRRVYFEYRHMGDDKIDSTVFIKPLKVKGNIVTTQDKVPLRVTVERIGGHVMLVARNASGIPVNVMRNVPPDQIPDSRWTAILLYNLIMGNYAIDGQESHAVFGPRMPFYSGTKYDTDPGIPNGYYVRPDYQSIDILYGSGRVSKGDPNNPKWGKMPGGGGAGAIMGPMEWNIKPSVDGLIVTVLHDERFVAHNPSIGKEGETVLLVKEQCPWEGLEGKWAFASVIPLTENMLKLFPKEVLTLMRGEIYARHGDTFKNAETQRYFDAQSWYKRGNTKSISLTDLERFNYRLIYQIENSRSR